MIMWRKKKLQVAFLLLGVLFFFSALVISLVQGCSGYKFVKISDLSSVAGVSLLDANNPFFTVTSSEPNRFHIAWGKTNLNMSGPKCHVKLLGGNRVCVMGKIGRGKSYPIVVDTGCPKGLVVNDVVVVERGLGIYPLAGLAENIGGLCHLNRLEIGEMVLENPICHYVLGHHEFELFGLTVWKQRQVVIGLSVIRMYSYVLLDIGSREAEFCAQGVFKGDPNESWSKYPMSIEKDASGQERLMVEMPISGLVDRIMFDTGASGLCMTEKIWGGFSKKVTVLKRDRTRLGTQFGLLSCEVITVESLSMGDVCVNDALIFVTENDTPYGETDLVLGVGGNFDNTAVVLDFKQNLLWVRGKGGEYPVNN